MQARKQPWGTPIETAKDFLRTKHWQRSGSGGQRIRATEMPRTLSELCTAWVRESSGTSKKPFGGIRRPRSRECQGNV